MHEPFSFWLYCPWFLSVDVRTLMLGDFAAYLIANFCKELGCCCISASWLWICDINCYGEACAWDYCDWDGNNFDALCCSCGCIENFGYCNTCAKWWLVWIPWLPELVPNCCCCNPGTSFPKSCWCIFVRLFCWFINSCCNIDVCCCCFELETTLCNMGVLLLMNKN